MVGQWDGEGGKGQQSCNGNPLENRSHGVILETKTRLEATRKTKELVRDRCTGDGVQKENFRPRRGTTVR
jgi:hypothetical protein